MSLSKFGEYLGHFQAPYLKNSNSDVCFSDTFLVCCWLAIRIIGVLLYLFLYFDFPHLKAHGRVYIDMLLEFILSQVNLVYIVTARFSEIYLNVILPPPGLPNALRL
jgi:hypothetical protein